MQQNVGDGYTSYNSMAVQSDGKIVVEGRASRIVSQFIGSVDFNYIERFNIDGS